jgi:hypothetical protein
MRCLYCGIRLKIAKQAQVIRYCPECSMIVECEERHAPPQKALREPLRTEKKLRKTAAV